MTPITLNGRKVEDAYVFDFQTHKSVRWLEKAVRWYKSDGVMPSCVKSAFGQLVCTLLGTTLILLPLVFRVRDLAYRCDQEKEAQKFYTAFHKGELGLTAPPPDEIAFKSEKATYNHINEYLIHQDTIWVRRRCGEQRSWRPIYFDGNQEGTKPMKIASDGANLIVVDDKNLVHYRKVLIEARGKQESSQKRIERHLPLGFSLEDEDQKTYVCIDKSLKINWKPMWYNFPLLHRIINVFTGKRLALHGDMALSHRSRFDDAYKDAAGNRHHCTIGVTTLYELDRVDSSVRKHDPWMCTSGDVRLYFPESKDHFFAPEKIDVSGSTLMTIGYKTDASGKKVLQVLTNTCDIDIAGGNPLLKYGYKAEGIKPEDAKKSGKRILPDRVDRENWHEHPLPKRAQVFYSQISIMQGFRGKRELRVAAKNEGGTLGYYRKELKHNTPWTFVPCQGVDQSHPLDRKMQVQTAAPEPEKTAVEIKKLGNLSHLVTKVNYLSKERGYHFALEVSDGKEKCILALHRRWGVGTFFGFKNDHFDLVVPLDQNNHLAQKIVQQLGQRVSRVRVKEMRKGVFSIN